MINSQSWGHVWLPNPQVAEEMNKWHDVGSGEAFEAACRKLGAPGFRPVLPRGLVDLNRGWKGRAKDEQETLFSKGAISALVHLLCELMFCVGLVF